MALLNGGANGMNTPTSSSDSVEQVTLCHICSDRATGNHYGAISCDGCKGFFRRSIRKEHNYKCRFNQNCNVDKTHRNACRACRLRRCMQAGMKAGAIQNERDVIGKRRKIESEGETSGQFLQSLLVSEKLCLQLRESVIKSTEQVVYDTGKIKYNTHPAHFATLNDVGTSIHQQLCILVEWAKSLIQFQELPLNDQAALLKACAAPLIVHGVAYRSLSTDGGVYLANEKILSTEEATLIGDINLVVSRIINELVIPMRELGYDSTDYVALKAIIFFNPYIIRPTNPTVASILKNARLLALKALKNQRPDDLDECRFGQLMLLLPAVHSIAQQLVEDVQLCHLFQLINVDDLMQELILNDGSKANKDTVPHAVIEKLKSPV
uniref:Nuclear receptor domain-containing protein n=1 Tax=Panagrellus redivivus TaxID=6233 RepID=A0A7E4UR32_PANRE